MDCKKALQESDGNFDEATDILRKKGQELSEKRSDREANQGLIVTKVSEDGSKAAALEINCETDFVARNDDFQDRAQQFIDLVLEHETESVDKLLEIETDNLTVEELLKQMVAKIGEKIEINKVVFDTTDGHYTSYVHPGSQLGVLVEFEDTVDGDDAGRSVAMQVAAMDPLAVNRDGVDESVVEQELEIAKDQLLNEGKTEEIAEKAAQGKLRKFYEERVLLEQQFVKDNSLTVKEYLETNGTPLVSSFHRLQLGSDS